ncbi:Cyclic pyranopterin monophosphate synthase, mitochondrial [Linum grandiflorum]
MFLVRTAVAASLSHSRRFLCTSKVHDFIAEMNKEMELVFGEVPPSGLAGSITRDHVSEQQPQAIPQDLQSSVTNNSYKPHNAEAQQIAGGDNLGLTHIDRKGEAQMVDVSPKDSTKRIAVASCKVMLGRKVFDMVLANQIAKGDVLTVAKIAGINGAKQTSTLIPLCHNIVLSHVRVDLKLNHEDHSVDIEGEAASTGKTGVEMEALTAVSTAGLTVYDMCKAASKDIQIMNIQLERKTGGKSGDWSRDDKVSSLC